MSWIYRPLLPVISAGGLEATTGTVTVTGQSVGLRVGRRLAVSGGAVAVVGGDVAKVRHLVLTVGTANVVVSSVPVSMIYTPDPMFGYPSGAGRKHAGKPQHVPPHLTQRGDMSDEEFWQVIRARRLRDAAARNPVAAEALDDEEDVIEMMLLAA